MNIVNSNNAMGISKGPLVFSVSDLTEVGITRDEESGFNSV